ncbi:MAG: lysine 2,3-aminomutase, partial [Lentisphaeria bacterium]|nr:lysine 2,3-aminomutase [Lentisphaeria bacterium]
DLPCGGGKVPLVPDYLEKVEGREYTFRNFRGVPYRYPDVRDPESEQQN